MRCSEDDDDGDNMMRMGDEGIKVVMRVSKRGWKA